MALEIGQGDEVITTPFTFVATAGSIARLGARPVFVDIDAETFNIDPEKIEAAITSRTKAIMPVHLFGLSAEMDPILSLARSRNIPVIEDSAQSIGARYHGAQSGTLGEMGCLSFFPSKNLGGAGDGGMILAKDAQVAGRLKKLRVHGSTRKYEYELVGINSRLDSLQAAILRVKLRHLDEWTEARRQNAQRYRELFRHFDISEVKVPVEPEGHFHVYNQFVIGTQQRDALREHLRQGGIPTETYYPSPLHLQQAFADLGYNAGDFPNAEAASLEVLALPICPELKPEQQEVVVQSISDFYRGQR